MVKSDAVVRFAATLNSPLPGLGYMLNEELNSLFGTDVGPLVILILSMYNNCPQPLLFSKATFNELCPV